MAFPLLTVGHVLNHAPDGYGVNVMLKSGESPMLPVMVGTHGPNDALRVNAPELPGRGTWGLIAFPHGDSRNGVWICSYNTNSLDAFTGAAGDTAVRYRSHLSGHWDMVDQNGNTAEQWPDGSSLVVGNGGTLPSTFRHTVDSSGKRQRTALTHAQRVPKPPGPLPRVFTHASGATVTITAAGVVSELSAAGQLINVGAVGDTLRKLIDERLVAAFNSHQHQSTGNAGSITSTPIVQLVTANVATTHLMGG